jgi:ABC-type dipeptide/oligopeptide/nickel transport system ATPase component
MMADPAFVAREQELGQLWQFLDRTLGSQGQVCFVIGEAGSGKTALVTEFAGRVQEALELVERAVATAQEADNLVTEAYARQIWGQALTELEPPRWNQAEAQLAESVRLFESGQAGLWAARACTAWGTICRSRGDPVAARKHWEKAAAQWKASGITRELETVGALIAALPEA